MCHLTHLKHTHKKNPPYFVHIIMFFYIIIICFFIISWKVSRLVHTSMGGTLWPRFAFVFDRRKRQLQQQQKTIPNNQPKTTTLWINNQYVQYIYFFIFLQDEYNLNPGLEWEDEFTGRYTMKKQWRESTWSKIGTYQFSLKREKKIR